MAAKKALATTVEMARLPRKRPKITCITSMRLRRSVGGDAAGDDEQGDRKTGKAVQPAEELLDQDEWGSNPAKAVMPRAAPPYT